MNNFNHPSEAISILVGLTPGQARLTKSAQYKAISILVGLTLGLIFLSFSVQAVEYTLTVIPQGQGYVSSSPSGILCGAACQESFSSGREITLTAVPAEGHSFQEWTGACTGTQITCTFELTEAKNVTAKFSGEQSSEYELRVYRTGGLGRITSDPTGIYCGSICTYDSSKFPQNSAVTLTAEATARGVEFIRWTGDCNGTEDTCTVILDAKKTVTGIFTGGETQEPEAVQPGKEIQTILTPGSQPIVEIQIIPKTYDLNIEIDGAGKGKVSALDYNIDCSQSCTKKIAERELVTLTATAEPGSEFIGWHNYCSGTQANCTLSFNSQKNVGALFEKSSAEKMDTGVGKLRSGKIAADPGKKTHQVWVYVTGNGTVTSQNQEISCNESGDKCVAEFEKGSQVTLTGKPDAGHRTVRWEGACQDPANGCIFTVDKLKNVWVSFAPIYYTLTVKKTGDGEGWIHTEDYKMNCGTSCSMSGKSGSTIILNVRPEDQHTFLGWSGGDCNGLEKTCAVKMDSDKEVTANITGATVPYELYVDSNGPGRVRNAEGDIDCKNSFCKKTYFRGNQIVLTAIPDVDSRFLGWGNYCIGTQPTCAVTMKWHNRATARFESILYYYLRVNNRVDGKVISKDGAIQCGGQCLARFENESLVALKSTEGMRWTGCDNWSANTCFVRMNADKVIETTITYEEEMEYIAKAIDETYGGPDFDGIPGLKGYLKAWYNLPFKKISTALAEKKMGTTYESIKAWAEQHKGELLQDAQTQKDMQQYTKEAVKQVLYEIFAEEIQRNSYLRVHLEIGKPMQTALADLTAKRNGGGVEGLKSWIRENKQWYLENTGIMDYLVTGMAREALLEVFAKEIQEFSNVYNYLYNANNSPIIQAVKDLREKKGGVGLAGLKSWIRQNRQWYIDNTGIAKYLKKPEPPKLPEITSIEPENLQITKPALIKGKNFINIERVTIDGHEVNYTKNSENEIKLKDTHWGIEGNPMVKVETNTGWYRAPMQYTNERIIRNANGKTEQCFGGVGKGCTGAGSEFFWGSHLVALQVGCEPEKNGKRRCWVAAGSIKHDNCCTIHSSGKQCGGPGTDGKPAEEDNHDGNCVTEWDEAKYDTLWRRAWTHDFPVGNYLSDLRPAQSPYNRLSNYEARESTILCAPSGHELRKMEDAVYCCSGRMNSDKKCT